MFTPLDKSVFFAKAEAKHIGRITTLDIPVTNHVTIEAGVFNGASTTRVMLYDLTVEQRQTLALGMAPWLTPKTAEDFKRLLSTYLPDLDERCLEPLAAHLAGNAAPLAVEAA